MSKEDKSQRVIDSFKQVLSSSSSSSSSESDSSDDTGIASPSRPLKVADKVSKKRKEKKTISYELSQLEDVRMIVG